MTENTVIGGVAGFCLGILLLVFVVFPMSEHRDTEVYAPENIEELVNWPEDDLYKLSNNLKCSTVSYTTIVPAHPDSEQASTDLEELKRMCAAVLKEWHKKYTIKQYNEATEGKKYLYRPKGDK